MKYSKARLYSHYFHLEGWHNDPDGIYVSIWAYKGAFNINSNSTEINCSEGQEMVIKGARYKKVVFAFSEKYPDGNAYLLEDIQKYYTR